MQGNSWARTSAQNAADQLARTLDGLRERTSTLEEAKAALDELDRQEGGSSEQTPGSDGG